MALITGLHCTYGASLFITSCEELSTPISSSDFQQRPTPWRTMAASWRTAASQDSPVSCRGAMWMSLPRISPSLSRYNIWSIHKTQVLLITSHHLQRSEVVDYSIPFDKASYKIVIKATGDKLEWLTYTKGKKLFFILHIINCPFSQYLI